MTRPDSASSGALPGRTSSGLDRDDLAAGSESVESTGDLGIPVGDGVLVDEGCGGGGVPEAVHQLGGARPGGRTGNQQCSDCVE